MKYEWKRCSLIHSKQMILDILLVETDLDTLNLFT